MSFQYESGADPNAQDVHGQGTLWYVQSLEGAEILVGVGVDLSLIDENECTARDVQNDDEIRALIEREAVTSEERGRLYLFVSRCRASRRVLPKTLFTSQNVNFR